MKIIIFHTYMPRNLDQYVVFCIHSCTFFMAAPHKMQIIRKRYRLTLWLYCWDAAFAAAATFCVFVRSFCSRTHPRVRALTKVSHFKVTGLNVLGAAYKIKIANRWSSLVYKHGPIIPFGREKPHAVDSLPSLHASSKTMGNWPTSCFTRGATLIGVPLQ